MGLGKGSEKGREYDFRRIAEQQSKNTYWTHSGFRSESGRQI